MSDVHQLNNVHMLVRYFSDCHCPGHVNQQNNITLLLGTHYVGHAIAMKFSIMRGGK